MEETLFGTRLSVPEDPDPAAPELIDAMHTAYRIGRDFLWERPDIPPAPPDAIGRRIEKLSGGSSSSFHAALAAFHLGAARPSEGSRRKSTPRVAHLASAQQALTRSFLAMHRDALVEVFSKSKRVGFADVVAWRTTLSGAMAVARVARVLHDAGARLWLPTIRMDMRDKIDLIAAFGPATGVCLQVKNDHAAAATVCTPCAPDDLATPADCPPEFMRGVRDHARRVGGAWHGLFVRVGSRGIPFQDLKRCQTIRRSLLAAVAGLVPEAIMTSATETSPPAP